MRLADLDALFVKITSRNSFTMALSIDDADGVMFLCPKCIVDKDGPIGTHSVICWRPRAITGDFSPGPGRWELVGTGLDDLSLVAGSSSVQLMGGCNAHFFVRSGEVVMT